MPVRDELVARLRAAGCVAAEDEARQLETAAPDHPTLERWIARREQGEPFAWVTGTTSFCGRQVRVDPGVYVPRPHTEELARRAAVALASAPGRAVDLCTGSGAVAAHLMAASPGTTVVGVDIDPVAVRCARRNGVRAIVGGVDAPLLSRSFDVVTAVAPYVPTGEIRFLPADVQRHEPHRALDGGEDGLDLVRRVVAAAARLLRSAGWLFVELGGEQDAALAPTLDQHGFTALSTWSDVDGDLRGLAARL